MGERENENDGGGKGKREDVRNWGRRQIAERREHDRERRQRKRERRERDCVREGERVNSIDIFSVQRSGL